MDFSSFLTSLGTSFVIFVVLMLLFTWLSRKQGNEVVYYPSRISRGLDPWEGRRRTRNPLAWIREAVHASEAEVIDAAGVDAAVYLVFLSSVMGILVLSGVALLPVLLPVSATDNSIKTADQSNSNQTFNNLDKLAMGNVQAGSSRLWAFLLATYWVSFVFFYVLWKSYEHVSSLRATAKSSSIARAEDFTILVRDIPSAPKGQTMNEHVDSYFKTLHPDSFYKSIIITENKMVEKIWNEMEDYKRKLAHAEVVYAESKSADKPDGVRPTHRIGFLGIIGQKVDTIDHCNEKISELLPLLKIEQKNALADKQKAAAIVLFNSRSAAASAAQTIHAQRTDSWTIMEAPEPRQLLWSNLPIIFYERQIRQILVYGIVFVTVAFYMIPIAAISAFTTLSNLRKLLPFLKKVLDQKAVKTVLEAFIPQLALIAFMALLPTFLMILSKAEGIASQSHAVRAASGKYFYFVVFNVFIGVTIGGTLIGSLKTIIDHPGKIVKMLGQSLPGNATFFLTFVALKFFVGYGLELSRVVPLILYHLKRKYLCKTEAELKEAWAPGDFGYATRVANDMLIVTIVFCYSVIAPLIIPFGALYFGLGWLLARNQALKVYIPSFESTGQMWPHMHARLVAALIIYQITMIGYMGLREFYYTPFLIPLPILSFIYAYICKQRFYRAFQHTPLEVACQGIKETPNLQSIYAAYIPHCLRAEKIDRADQFDEVQIEARSPTP